MNSSQTFLTIVTAGITAALGILGYQQAKGERTDSLEGRISANEVRLEIIPELKNRTDSIYGLRTDLNAVKNNLSGRASVSELNAVTRKIGQIEETLKELENRTAGVGGSVSPKQIAAILAQDYADVLRGPQGAVGPRGPVGPVGPAGPEGPAGSGSGAAVIQDENVRSLMEFTSDYGSRQIGTFKIDLKGCYNNGGNVNCKFRVLNTGSDRSIFDIDSFDQRIALANGEWVGSSTVRILRYTASNHNDVEYMTIPDLPVELEVDFPDARTKDSGLPVVKLKLDRPSGSVEWNKDKFAGG